MNARTRLRLDSANEPNKILFVNQYYWPDRASTAQHLTDLAESLAERGYECHVVCCKGGYQGNRSDLPTNEVYNGVHIHRVGSTSLGRGSTLRRMIDYLSFYVAAVLRALYLPRCDVSVTLTTPPIIGLIGVLLSKWKSARHVFWSMDLHPDAGLALGFLSRKNPAIGMLSWLSDAVYRSADRVIVLGPYMADRIAAKRVRRNRVEMISVWSRREEIYPIDREGHPLRKALGLEDKFVAMYSGNLGMAHVFDEFLEAARKLRHREDIVFLFVGDGPRKKEVASAKSSEGLDNVLLMDYFPREQLHESLSLADVHLISMRREMTGIVVPCKLYGAMASGRPAIFVGPQHCETADTIRESACGLTVRLGESSVLVDSILTMANDPASRKEMGERGRDAFLRDFERSHCCEQWSLMLSTLLGEQTQPVLKWVETPPMSRTRKLAVPVPSRVRGA